MITTAVDVAHQAISTAHRIFDVVMVCGGTCSVLHTILPPWDWDAKPLEDFPYARRFVLFFVRNRWYKLMIAIIGFAAVNLRTTVWHAAIQRSTGLTQ